MGSIYGRTYPDIGILEAEQILKVIDNTFSGEMDNLQDLPTLAKLLGHKTSRSGVFRNKVIALTRYGLLVKDKGIYSITDLGLRLLKGDRIEALGQIIARIELFLQIKQEMKEEFPDKGQYFTEVLQSIVGGDLDERKIERVRKLYHELVRDLLLAKPHPSSIPQWDKKRFDKYFLLLDDPILRQTAISVIFNLAAKYVPPDRTSIDQIFGLISKEPDLRLTRAYVEMLSKGLGADLTNAEDLATFRNLFIRQMENDPKQFASNGGYLEVFETLFRLLLERESEQAYQFAWQGFELLISGRGSWGIAQNLFGELIEKYGEYSVRLEDEALKRARDPHEPHAKDFYLTLLHRPLRLT